MHELALCLHAWASFVLHERAPRHCAGSVFADERKQKLKTWLRWLVPWYLLPHKLSVACKILMLSWWHKSFYVWRGLGMGEEGWWWWWWWSEPGRQTLERWNSWQQIQHTKLAHSRLLFNLWKLWILNTGGLNGTISASTVTPPVAVNGFGTRLTISQNAEVTDYLD